MKQTIKELRNSCAPGINNITKKDILTLFIIIGPIIVEIINQILKSKDFPKELKRKYYPAV